MITTKIRDDIYLLMSQNEFILYLCLVFAVTIFFAIMIMSFSKDLKKRNEFFNKLNDKEKLLIYKYKKL